MQGVCSRREADRLTEAGRVTVNGMPVSTGMKISAEDKICIDGKPIKNRKKRFCFFFINRKELSAVPDSSEMK